MNYKVLGLATLLGGSLATVHAEVLVYTGAALTNIQNSESTPAPVPAFLSGTLILGTNLAPNMVDQLVTPLSFNYASPAGFLNTAFQSF